MPKPKNRSDLPIGSRPPLDLEEASVLLGKELEVGDPDVFEPIETGFGELDKLLGGGLHMEDFIILGGPQNVGKTALILQWAIEIASQGALAIVICYEHSEVLLLQRLLCILSGKIAESKGDNKFRITFDKLRKAYRESIIENGNKTTITHVLEKLEGGAEAWQLKTNLWRNIWLIYGDGNNTDIESIEGYLKMADEYQEEKASLTDTPSRAGGRKALFIDYVQIVHVRPQQGVWLRGDERTDYVLVGLNALSKKYRMPVVAVSSADRESLRKGRIHLEDLEASSKMQYEPGAALILNRDEPGPNHERYVRFSLEKNRMGPSEVEWRHEYYGEIFRFNDTGEVIEGAESWQNERQITRKASEEANQ